jgi:hypothetical protein
MTSKIAPCDVDRKDMTFVSNADCYIAETRNLWLSLQLTLLIELTHTRKHPTLHRISFQRQQLTVTDTCGNVKILICLITEYLSTIMRKRGINGSTDFSKN